MLFAHLYAVKVPVENFTAGNFAADNFTVRKIRRAEISHSEIFAARNFHHPEFLTPGNFFHWNARCSEISPPGILPGGIFCIAEIAVWNFCRAEIWYSGIFAALDRVK